MTEDEKKMKQRNKAEQRKKTLEKAIDTLKKTLAAQEAELEKIINELLKIKSQPKQQILGKFKVWP